MKRALIAFALFAAAAPLFAWTRTPVAKQPHSIFRYVVFTAFGSCKTCAHYNVNDVQCEACAKTGLPDIQAVRVWVQYVPTPTAPLIPLPDGGVKWREFLDVVTPDNRDPHALDDAKDLYDRLDSVRAKGLMTNVDSLGAHSVFVWWITN